VTDKLTDQNSKVGSSRHV